MNVLLESLVWIVPLVGGALLLDRLLLAAEARGWIYYRKRRPVRGVSMCHLNELSQLLGGPGVPEIREEVDPCDAGDPLGRRREDG